MIEIPQREFNIGIRIPDIQLADVMKTGYRISKRLSTIIHDTTDAAGLLSRSALDDPASARVHLTYSLFRKLPNEGSKTRVLLDRKETKRALDGYCTELQAALTHLRAVPALPLDHPDLRSTL
jgi:Holliday junction resolvase RusA-like endonuclease